MEQFKFNKRQQKAFDNIYQATIWLIGENENTLSDCPEDSDEYKQAKEWLADHARIVDDVYQLAVTSHVTKDGSCGPDPEFINDIKFCGKEFLMLVSHMCVAWQGY